MTTGFVQQGTISESGIDDVPIDISSTDHVLASPSRGFHCNANGVAYLKLANSSHFTPYTLVGGLSYGYSVIAVQRSGSTAGANVFIAVY